MANEKLTKLKGGMLHVIVMQLTIAGSYLRLQYAC